MTYPPHWLTRLLARICCALGAHTYVLDDDLEERCLACGRLWRPRS